MCVFSLLVVLAHHVTEEEENACSLSDDMCIYIYIYICVCVCVCMNVNISTELPSITESS